MRIRKELLGIVLAFSTTGIIATSVNASAYQHVYDKQEKQEQKINALLKSEFISEEEQSALNDELAAFDQVRHSENRQGLLAIIAQNEEQLVQVKTNVASTESKAVQSELKQMKTGIDALIKKSDEPFIIKEDQEQIVAIQTTYQDMFKSNEIEPVRSFAKEVTTLTEKVTSNQKNLVSLVDTLKKDNQTIDTLMKKEYLLDTDKKELTQNKTVNQQYFEDADEILIVEEQQSISANLIENVSQRQEAAAKEFKDYGSKAKSLINDAKSLLDNGDLSEDESKALSAAKTSVENTVAFKAYKQGDLKDACTALESQYGSKKTISDKRTAEKKEAAEAAAKAEAEKLAREQAEAEKQSREQAEKAAQAEQAKATEAANQVSNNQAASSPTLVGEWYQAPAGYKFLKVESGKTYGQVKNPGNFSLITVIEAQNYSPGHGNGSAKQ